MTGSLNKAMLIGNLGADPERRATQSGTAVSNMSIATNRVWTDKNGEKQQDTEWHRVVVFGRLAEVVSEQLTKGQKVFVEGRIQTNEWQDRDGNTNYTTEIVANNIQFLTPRDQPAGQYQQGGPPPARGPSGSPNQGQAGPGGGADFEQSFDDDDIPF